MKYLLALTYVVFFCWIIGKHRFFTKSGIRYNVLIVLFSIKILFCILNAFIHVKFYKGGDAYQVYKSAKVLFSAADENIWYYLRLVFGPNGGYIDPHLFKYTYEMGFWDHTGYYSIARFHAILYPFSLGNYVVHVMIMAFLMFLAGMFTYKVCLLIKDVSKIWAMILIFLVPSFLFWTGSIHKDGFTYLGISMTIYGLCYFLKEKKRLFLLHCILGVLLIFLMRPYILVILFPSLLAYCWTYNRTKGILIRFAMVYLIGGLAIISIEWIKPSVPIYESIINKQVQFIAESGNSDFGVKVLKPNLGSLVRNTPKHVYHVITQPPIRTAQSPLTYASAIGTMLFWLICFVFLLNYKSSKGWSSESLLFLSFALGYLLVISWVVSNAGTMVRYRVVAFHFLWLFFLGWTNFERWEQNKLSESLKGYLFIDSK